MTAHIKKMSRYLFDILTFPVFRGDKDFKIFLRMSFLILKYIYYIRNYWKNTL